MRVQFIAAEPTYRNQAYVVEAGHEAMPCKQQKLFNNPGTRRHQLNHVFACPQALCEAFVSAGYPTDGMEVKLQGKLSYPSATLVMVLVGVMNLRWMVALALVILIEKSWRFGKQFGYVFGVALIVLAAFVPANPELLPGIVMR